MELVVPSAVEVGTTRARISLYWLPLGAGDHCVHANGRVYEAIVARYERRPVCDLYHSALEVELDEDSYVIESAPAWGSTASERGVVGVGPVGLSWLGHSRFFRYEVRRWRDGVIPDAAAAVGGPLLVSTARVKVERLLGLVPHFPTATWGRDELRAGEMWNSNSLIAWLLARSGHDVEVLRPPAFGRAPGWSAGLVVAARRPC
ncbi:MAG: hypothetical protein QOK30_3225 [Nocardioidaceae bacterium]|jgi:hypothetical protein|nr:hypothetical protein [Nocardioidaceae bacterium]